MCESSVVSVYYVVASTCEYLRVHSIACVLFGEWAMIILWRHTTLGDGSTKPRVCANDNSIDPRRIQSTRVKFKIANQFTPRLHAPLVTSRLTTLNINLYTSMVCIHMYSTHTVEFGGTCVNCTFAFENVLNRGAGGGSSLVWDWCVEVYFRIIQKCFSGDTKQFAKWESSFPGHSGWGIMKWTCMYIIDRISIYSVKT